MEPASLCNVTEAVLAELVTRARYRLVFAAPGVGDTVAHAISAAWERLGAERATVVMDVDPEVCRLGYGTLEGLEILQAVARKVGGLVCHQPGIRICVVVCDDETLVFSPTPLLVEAGSPRLDQPNGIRLAAPPAQLASDLGLAGDEPTRAIGLDAVQADDVAKVAADLKANPPVQFDVARKVRVFNAALEFVEFELHGCFLSRKTVEIPSDLLGLAQDAETRRRLRSSFKLLDETDTVGDQRLSEENLKTERKRIADAYLRPLKGFGTVILRANKEEFLAEVRKLEAQVEAFRAALQKQLEGLMDTNAQKLTEALFASVKEHPPVRWKGSLGPKPSDAALKEQLSREVRTTFGAADDIAGEMKVACVFKGVTYETLVDPAFQQLVQEKFPGLVPISEFEAARPAELFPRE